MTVWVVRIDANEKEYVPDELFVVVDTTIVFIINSNEGSGDTDRCGGKRISIQCISGSRCNIVISEIFFVRNDKCIN